jgi:DNA-binding response OmpR family regulator
MCKSASYFLIDPGFGLPPLEALEEALWGDDCPDSDSLRSHIHQLRQVLDKPFANALLHTLHGVGYRLAE